jgi:hypothetical protein
MSLHRNRVQVAVSAAPGTGAVALGAAYPGFQSFSQAYGQNALVDILLLEGTAWEVCRSCNYDHATQTVTRGTLEDGSNGKSSRVTFGAAATVSVVPTAGWANDVEEFLNAESQVVKAFAQIVGNGTATSFSIAHNLDSLNMVVLIRTTAAPIVKVEETAYDVEFIDGDNLTITFAVAPTVGQYEVFCATFATGSVIVPPSLGGKQTYDIVGTYSFVVPAGVTELTAKVWGAGGGGAGTGGPGSGGGGGFGKAQLAVVPGEVLTVRVGGGGLFGIVNSRPAGGGGLCGVFRGASLPSATPLAIGGSGGGAAANGATQSTRISGAPGGGLAGGDGGRIGSGSQFARGGTQVGGGSGVGGGVGLYLEGGGVGTTSTSGLGGSGGAGYYGGGGGSGISTTAYSGGGGSGYVPSPGSPLLASGAPTPTLTAGSDATPAGQADPDYGLTNAGLGGGGGGNGNPGRVVLIW